MALVDLGHGWPDDYVEADLARALPGPAARLPAGAGIDTAGPERRRLLAWIVGRSDDPDLHALTP